MDYGEAVGCSGEEIRISSVVLRIGQSAGLVESGIEGCGIRLSGCLR